MQRFTAKQYLQIDIANNFGLDKEDWLDRLKWFEQNESQLELLVNQAEEPALYHAGVMAYREVEAGKPIGYPVAFDATASGMQILSCLTGDRQAASLCNVINTGRRVDGYTAIYLAMLEVLGEGGKIDRKDVKSAVMTSFYGSEAIPKQVFGEGVLLRIFEDVMSTKAPAAWELNQFFLSIWDPEATAYHWVLPDNFHVHTKVMVKEQETVHFLNKPYDTFREVQGTKEKGRSLSANSVHSLDGMVVREMVRRCDYDRAKVDALQTALVAWNEHMGTVEGKDTDMVRTLWAHYEESGYLSARIIDHLNLGNLGVVDIDVIQDLLDSLPAKPFKVLTVHDCFRCLPNYVNDLREQYNRQLMLIAKSDLLSFLLSQIMGKKIKIGKLDADLWKDIMDSDYALS